MCGIAGIAGLKGLEAPEALVKRMTDALAHRGPNAEGVWRDDDVVLGHRRLSIIDLSDAGNQPFHSADGRYTIVFNGEIYNYRELKAELTDHTFRTATDTEVLLAAFHQWGIECLHKLHGMFAFALWDAKTRELWLVRDRLGIKPIYFHRSGERLLFASELRALLATGLVPRGLDTDALADYVRYQTVHAPATLVKNVRMLMPGHWMRWKAGEVKTECYWHLVKNAQRDAAHLPIGTIQREVRDRLARAVERRLVCDVPFGAFLSGGIDSSAIVGLMAQVSTTPVHTFSVVFDDPKFSEEKYARIVAKKFATKHTTIRLQPDDILRLLPEVLGAMDHPSGDGPNTYVVSKVTKEAGITMALSGLGSDEIFAGYPVFTRSLSLWKQRWLMGIPRPLRSLAASALLRVKRSPASYKVADLLRLSSVAVEDTYPISRLGFTDRKLAAIIAGDPLPRNEVRTILHRLMHEQGGALLPLLGQVSLAEISTYMQNILLRDTDQMSMAHALEVRVPFLDHELVEFVMGVNDEQKFPHTPKKLLVDSLGDLLPPQIVNRPKMGFTLPWSQWMKTALRSYCASRMDALSKHSAFRAAGVHALWQSFVNGDKGVSWAHIWHLVVLADWIERNGIE